MKMTAVLALAALLATAGCIDLVGADSGKYVERETKHFTTSGTPDLNLDTFDGGIEIRAWDKPDVEVVIEKRAVTKVAAATIEIRSDQRGNQVTVEAKVPKSNGFGLHFNYSRSARLIVSAPASSNLLARSGDGSITVERITGRLELRSGDVNTGDGSVVVTGTLTTVHARSGDGSVTVRAKNGSSPAADWEITTGDGSITLELPEPFDAELDAHTGDGGIHMNDVTLSNVSGKIGRNSVRGQLGSGGRLVRLRTGDGSITLNRIVAAERGTM